jgi:fatty-acyl-CoA synthase
MYPGTHAQKTPDKPAVVMVESGRQLTFRQLEDRSIQLARVLRKAGLRRGDTVAVLSENQPEVFEVYWAALRSGLYLTAVNHRLAADEAAYIVDDCDAKALIVSAGERERAEVLLDSTPAVRLRLAFGGAVNGHGDYEGALARQFAVPLADQPRGADLLYSSGTTGRPKGIKAPLPDRQVHEPGDAYTALFSTKYGFDDTTVYLSPAPLYHAAPLRFGGVVQALGGTVHVMAKFDPALALSTIDSARVTHSQWVPTMFVRMLKLSTEERAQYDVSSLRSAIHAAAPCPVEVKHAMIDWWGPILHEYYSSTEGNGITFIDCQEWLRKPGSVGKAGLGVIRICDDEGQVVPSGTNGVVYFEREQVPFEYHKDPAKTKATQHPEHPNWSTTGDIGYLDEDGYLYLTDRKAFTIISGGVNIYPQEIENCLALHPKVFDVAVIGIPDPEMGESVQAVVQLPPHVIPSNELAAELQEYVRERIARYKAPRGIDFVTELPRTETGKLLKRVLRDRYTSRL